MTNETIAYCNYCEQSWTDGHKVKECPTCCATVCKSCEESDKHQGCAEELWKL